MRRTVEMYVGYLNQSWGTEYVTIPADTAETDVGRVAIDALTRQLAEQGIEAAFLGIYDTDELAVFDEDEDGLTEDLDDSSTKSSMPFES